MDFSNVMLNTHKKTKYIEELCDILFDIFEIFSNLTAYMTTQGVWSYFTEL